MADSVQNSSSWVRSLVLCLLLGLLCIGAGMAIGSRGFELPWSAGLEPQIVWQLRLPRTLGAWLVGFLLGLAGALAQALLRNPLADPYLLGSASGAAAGFALTVVGVGAFPWLLSSWQQLGYTGAAFVGAFVAMLMSLLLAQGAQHSLRLLLAGMVVSVVLGALTTTLMLAYPQEWPVLQSFMLGSTAFISPNACVLLAASACVCTSLALCFAPALQALVMGEDSAYSLGVPLNLVRWGVLGIIAWASAAAVSQAGLIAFVGLAAPHIVRSLGFYRQHEVLVLAGCTGGLLLALADVFSRWLWAPQELPVGVFTALIGGIYLLWVMGRRNIQD